jgi:uridylate kinase
VKLAYRRILLKVSGEALQGKKNTVVIDAETVDKIASELADLNRLGLQIGIVVGAGNFFRGATLSLLGIDRVTADQMGMVSTVVNALALRDALEKNGITTSIMSAIPMSGIVDHYDRRRAIHHLQENRIVIFAGGTGNPLVTTDSAASLRSIEIEANILLKATNVDGIYSEDPQKNPSAKLYTHLTYQEALQKELGVMDLTAFCQCRDNHMPIRVFNLNKPNSLRRIISGESEGTLVDEGNRHVK